MNMIERAVRGEPDSDVVSIQAKLRRAERATRTALTFGIIGTAFGATGLVLAIVALALAAR